MPASLDRQTRPLRPPQQWQAASENLAGGRSLESAAVFDPLRTGSLLLSRLVVGESVSEGMYPKWSAFRKAVLGKVEDPSRLVTVDHGPSLMTAW